MEDKENANQRSCIHKYMIVSPSGILGRHPQWGGGLIQKTLVCRAPGVHRECCKGKCEDPFLALALFTLTEDMLTTMYLMRYELLQEAWHET